MTRGAFRPARERRLTRLGLLLSEPSSPHGNAHADDHDGRARDAELELPVRHGPDVVHVFGMHVVGGLRRSRTHARDDGRATGQSSLLPIKQRGGSQITRPDARQTAERKALESRTRETLTFAPPMVSILVKTSFLLKRAGCVRRQVPLPLALPRSSLRPLKTPPRNTLTQKGILTFPGAFHPEARRDCGGEQILAEPQVTTARAPIATSPS